MIAAVLLWFYVASVLDNGHAVLTRMVGPFDTKAACQTALGKDYRRTDSPCFQSVKPKEWTLSMSDVRFEPITDEEDKIIHKAPRRHLKARRRAEAKKLAQQPVPFVKELADNPVTFKEPE